MMIIGLTQKQYSTLLLSFPRMRIGVKLRNISLISPLWKRGARGDLTGDAQKKSPLIPLFQRGRLQKTPEDSLNAYARMRESSLFQGFWIPVPRSESRTSFTGMTMLPKSWLKTTRIYFLASCFLFLASCFRLFAAPPVLLNDNQGQYPLGLHLDLLEDPTGALTIEQVAQIKTSEAPNSPFTIHH